MASLEVCCTCVRLFVVYRSRINRLTFIISVLDLVHKKMRFLRSHKKNRQAFPSGDRLWRLFKLKFSNWNSYEFQVLLQISFSWLALPGSGGSSKQRNCSLQRILSQSQMVTIRLVNCPRAFEFLHVFNHFRSMKPFPGYELVELKMRSTVPETSQWTLSEALSGWNSFIL